MDKIKRLANGYMYIRIPKEEYFKKETDRSTETSQFFLVTDRNCKNTLIPISFIYK